MHYQENQNYSSNSTPVIPDGNGGFMPCPQLMTEEELIRLLRIPEISTSGNYSNVIANLKRMPDLPRLHICGKTLYPAREIANWISEKCSTGK